MKKILFLLSVVGILSGCASSSALKEKITNEQFDAPKVEQSKYFDKNKLNLRCSLPGNVGSVCSCMNPFVVLHVTKSPKNGSCPQTIIFSFFKILFLT